MIKIKYILIFILSFTIGIINVKADYSIKEGTYIIKSAINNNQVLDAANGIAVNGTNVHVYHNNFTNAQKWIITYEDNYYTITSTLNPNMAIDIYNGKKFNRNNIQLYNKNKTDAQKWNIKHVGKSLFEIISNDGKYCIDLNNGYAHDWNNVQLYQCNHTKAQHFKFVELIESEKTLEDGLYTITSASNEKMALDVTNGHTKNKTNIQLYNVNNTDAQKWYIKYINDGFYYISSKLDKNKCMDIANGDFTSGTNVHLYECNNSDNQKWIIKKLENDFYQLITKVDAVALDVAGGIAKNGTNIQIFHNNLTNAQKFKLTKIDETILEDGIYTIKSKINKNKAIDVNNGSSLENTNIQIYDSNNTNAQKWYITRLDNEYYTIKSGLNSNLYLSATKNESEANVLTTTKQTEWKLEYINENEYYIISKDNGLYLNLENAKTENKTNINILSKNESDAQKFYFEKSEINQNEKTISDGYYTINSKLNSNKSIDVTGAKKLNNTNIQLYDSNNTNAQVWYLKYQKDGYYYITSSMNPNTLLSLKEDNVQLYKNNNSDSQLWKLKDDGNGNISIISKKNNTCITVENSKTENSTNIEANNCDYKDNQKFKLNIFTKKLIYTGIDVSQYQGKIDWEKVSNNNIGFAILRLGYGDNWTSQDDKRFEENVLGCEKYNIPYGIYLYSYAKNIKGTTELNKNSESAESEAAHVLRLLNKVNYKPNLKTSVYIDMEEPTLEYLGKTQLTNISDKFCTIIEENGFGCGIYANKSWLNKYLDAKNLSTKYAIWLAEWTNTELAPTYTQAINLKPSYNLTDYKLWQFSSKGSISGINGYIDVDLGFNIFN